LIFLKISAFSIGIPIVLSFFFFKSIKGNLIPFALFIYFSALLDMACGVLNTFHVHNNFISHIDTLNEVVLLGYFYYTVFENQRAKKFTLTAIILSATFVCINAFLIQGIEHFNSYSRMLSSVFFIVFALTYLRSLFISTPIKYLERDPVFWISTGTLFYFTGTLFVFVAFRNANFGLSDKVFTQIWYINSFFNILQNVLFGIAFICNRKT